jgi:hypothetical protein
MDRLASESLAWFVPALAAVFAGELGDAHVPGRDPGLPRCLT